MMTIHIHATYKAGVIHPERPLNLPENTEVDLTVVPIVAGDAASSMDADAVRPPAPRISAEELRARIAQHAVSVRSLPADFSRADIYQDHD